MKEFFKEIWLLIAGAGVSVSFKGIEDITQNDLLSIVSQNSQYVTHDPFWHYLIIGGLGAIGGLVVKIIWMMIKRKYPKLKELDK